MINIKKKACGICMLFEYTCIYYPKWDFKSLFVLQMYQIP